MKHILFAHRKLSFGGGERVLVEQIASLAHVPVEISVLFRKEKRRRDLESEIRQRNPHVVAIEYRPSVWGVYRWIKTHRPDVVVLCNHKGAMFALLLLALQGVKIPLLVTLHEHYPAILEDTDGLHAGLMPGSVLTTSPWLFEGNLAQPLVTSCIPSI